MGLSEHEVQGLLRSELRRKQYRIIVENWSSYAYSEADMMVISSSDYWFDYEIKTDRGDLLSEVRAFEGDGIYSRSKRKKHRAIQVLLDADEIPERFEVEPGSDRRQKMNTGRVPNRYYLVTPSGMAEPDELPDPWGMYEVYPDEDHPRDRVDKVKRADLIHRQTVNRRFLIKLCKLLYGRHGGKTA